MPPLHRAELSFFNSLKSERPKIDAPLSLSEQRKLAADLFKKYSGPLTDAPYQDQLIPVRDGSKVRVRIFNPNKKGITLFFLHGNAFIFDLFEGSLAAASRLAKQGNFKVVSIDYRGMPENSWPTPIDDIEDVMTHMCQNAGAYFINPQAIYLLGVCSGALAATLVMLRSKGTLPVKCLILLNGLYDLSLSQNNYAFFEQADMLIQRNTCRWWRDVYGITSDEAKSPDYSPLYADNFSTLPKTFLLVAEYDGFRSDTEAFYLQLQAHGATVKKVMLRGQTHNTLLLRGAITSGRDPAETLSKLILNEHSATQSKP